MTPINDAYHSWMLVGADTQSELGMKDKINIQAITTGRNQNGNNTKSGNSYVENNAGPNKPEEIHGVFCKQTIRLLKHVYPFGETKEEDWEIGHDLAFNFTKTVLESDSSEGKQMVFIFAVPVKVESGLGHFIDVCVGGKDREEAQDRLMREYIPNGGDGNDISYGELCFIGVHDYDTGRTSFVKDDPAFHVCRINWLNHTARILEDSIL